MIWRPSSVDEWFALIVTLFGVLTVVGVLAVLVGGCATAEKLLTATNANHGRTALRQVCADIAEADRLAGIVLDDAGVPADQ